MGFHPFSYLLKLPKFTGNFDLALLDLRRLLQPPEAQRQGNVTKDQWIHQKNRALSAFVAKDTC